MLVLDYSSQAPLSLSHTQSSSKTALVATGEEQGRGTAPTRQARGGTCLHRDDNTHGPPLDHQPLCSICSPQTGNTQLLRFVPHTHSVCMYKGEWGGWARGHVDARSGHPAPPGLSGWGWPLLASLDLRIATAPGISQLCISRIAYDLTP